jgi:hypothetical protein
VVHPAAAQTMSRSMNREYWELLYSVEVSALYHDWRRSFLWTVVRTVRGITLSGAIIVLITALVDVHAKAAVGIIAGVSILSAIVSLWDLVENFSQSAQLHERLYQQFKKLQAQVRLASDAPEKIKELYSEADSIRVDEPPTLWAVYARAWNQVIEHHSAERPGYYREVSPWRSLLGNFVHFNPQNFPAISGAAS